MEKLVGQTIETVVKLGEKTVKLIYGLLVSREKDERQPLYGIEVRMEADGLCEVERKESVTDSLDSAIWLMNKISEGVVMPFSLGEIVEDFVALSPAM